MASKSKTRKKKTKKAEPKKPRKSSEVFKKLNAPGSFDPGELKIIAVIFAVAVIVRSIYFFINKAHNPLFYHPNLDALFHHNWAKDILNVNFWGDEAFFKAPLYPYFLAFLYKISGTSIAFAVYCQHLVGALSVVLVYLLSRRFFSVRVAAVAGFIASLYWPLMYFEGDLLAVTLVVFLDLLFLLAFTVAAQRRSTGLLLLSGVLLGTSAIARPSILILVPVIPLVFYYIRTGTEDAAGDWKKQTLVVFAGLLIIVLPVVLRNYIVGGDLVPIASQGGVNFYIGNNPQSNGSLAMVPGAPANMYGTYRGAIEMAEKETGRSMKPSEVSNFYFKKGLSFIVNSPSAAGKLLVKKFYLFWAGVERSNNKYIQFFWKRFGLGRFPLFGFWLVGPLALLGGVLLWPRRRESALLYLFVIAYMVGVVAFFVNARFRLPVMPVLIILSAYSLCYLYGSFRENSTDFGKALLLLLALEFAVNYDYIAFRGVRALDEAITYRTLGNAYLDMGKRTDALNEFIKARKVQEKYPTRGYLEFSDEIDYKLGMIYRERGQLSHAIEALERIRGRDKSALRARNLLADCYLKKGRLDDAIRTYVGVQKLAPDDVDSRIGIAVAYRLKGEAKLLDLSEKILRQMLQNPHAYNDRVHLELARTLEEKGDFDGAVQSFLAASTNMRYRLDAFLGLAWLYKKTGDMKSAGKYASLIKNEFPVNPRLQAELRAILAK